MGLSINAHNQLLNLSSPLVMAIINVTPDSFYTAWGNLDTESLLQQVQNAIDQGAEIIDIGAYSTRPNHAPISAQEEWQRLSPALRAIRSHFPNTLLSIDTFRADIAEQAIAEGADIINDVYGGEHDKRIWEVVAQHHTPYVLTYAQDIQPQHRENAVSCMLHFFQSRLDTLHNMGVADVIIDPGFGFSKTEEQNYHILQQLHALTHLRAPILVGMSRKSMLYKPLSLTPSDVLPATVAANTLALERGANILRVHDVAAAKQAITIYSLTHKQP